MKLIGIKGYILVYIYSATYSRFLLSCFLHHTKSFLLGDIFSGDRGEMSTANTADSLPEDYRVFNFERPEERDR